LIAFMALAALMAQPQDDPLSEGSVVDDVIVIASRSAKPFDVFAPFEERCFDGNRLNQRATLPLDDPLWLPLEQADRIRLNLLDERQVAFKTERDGLLLVLTINERQQDGLAHNNCRLTISGRHDPGTVTEKMIDLLNGQGTTNHLGVIAGYDRREGWTQTAWVGNPARNSSRWKTWRPEGGALLISHPRYFRSHSYFVADVQSLDRGDESVTQISLKYVFRPNS